VAGSTSPTKLLFELDEAETTDLKLKAGTVSFGDNLPADLEVFAYAMLAADSAPWPIKVQ
jgi:hypothetical protein